MSRALPIENVNQSAVTKNGAVNDGRTRSTKIMQSQTIHNVRNQSLRLYVYIYVD